MLLNCLVIDDEPIARKGILEHISQIGYLNPLKECKNVVEALHCIDKEQVDVLFLDIQMPKMSGIDFVRSLKQPIPTVFTTAYSEHALEGFELGVLDYLLKPITFPRFLKTAIKIQDYYSSKNPALDAKYFFIKCHQKIEKIMISDVTFIEGLANYIAIHTPKKKYITYLTFKSIEEKLPPSQFIRIHKSYLVSINAIQSIDTDMITLNDIELPLSKKYKTELMERVNKNLFRRI